MIAGVIGGGREKRRVAGAKEESGLIVAAAAVASLPKRWGDQVRQEKAEELWSICPHFWSPCCEVSPPVSGSLSHFPHFGACILTLLASCDPPVACCAVSCPVLFPHLSPPISLGLSAAIPPGSPSLRASLSVPRRCCHCQKHG